MTTSASAAQPAVVRVLDARGVLHGAGFLGGERLVCTCAHVVNAALGLALGNEMAPGESVVVDFPFLDGSQRTATVVAWSSVTASDVAVLRLAEDPPPGAHPVRLLDSAREGSRDFTVWGFPSGNDQGAEAQGRVRGVRAGGDTVQLDGDTLQGYMVQPGFSGAPVWDPRARGVIGMMVKAERDSRVRVSVMVTTRAIQEVHPALTVEEPVGLAALGDGLALLPNSPLTSLEHFLNEYYGAGPGGLFGGREETLDELDDWLADSSQGRGLLVAEAGRGKSSLLVHWVAELLERGAADVALLPVSLRFNTADWSTSASMLGARLRHLYGEAGDNVGEAGAWATEIGTLLRQDHPTRPLLVVIDGADEATDWVLGRNLLFPVRLGEGVKILVSARTTSSRDEAGWRKVLAFEDARVFPLPPLSAKAVADLLRTALEPDATPPTRLVGDVVRLSEGDPLLVRLWAESLHEHVKRGRALEDIDLGSSPSGLKGFFSRWWEDQEILWGATHPDLNGTRQRQVLQFFYLCASALGPLSRDEVASMGKKLWKGVDLPRISQDASRFVIGDGREQGWVFSHPRLGHFFHETRMTQEDVGKFEDRILHHGRATLQSLQAGRPSHPHSRYALRYYGAHLEQSHRRLSEQDARHADGRCDCGILLNDLLDPHWQVAREQLDGTLDGFLLDINRAWDHLRPAASSSLGSGALRDSSGVDRLVRCALLLASVRHVEGAHPTAFVVALVRAQVWTVPQALAHVRGLTEWEQASALGELMPLARVYERDIVELARSMSSIVDRTRALVMISRHLDDDRAQGLVAEAGAGIDDDHALEAVELLQPCPELLDAVMRRIDQMDESAERVAALARASLVAPPETRQRLVSAALEYAAAMPVDDLADVAASLLPLAKSPLQDQLVVSALARARAIRNPEERARTLAALVSVLPDGNREQGALETVQAIGSVTNDVFRMVYLESVAEHLSPTHLPLALRVVRSLGTEGDDTDSRALQHRVSALARVAGKLPASSARGLTAEAFETAESIEEDFWRELALAELAESASVEELGQLERLAGDLPKPAARLRVLSCSPAFRAAMGVAELAQQVLSEPQDLSTLSALASLAPFLDVDTVLMVGRAVLRGEDSSDLATDLSLIDRVITLAQDSAVSGDLLSLGVDLLFRLSRGFSRDMRLAEMAPLMSPDLLRDVLARSRVIDDGWERIRASISLLAPLGTDVPDALVSEIVGATRSNASYSVRWSAITELIDILDPGQIQRQLGAPIVEEFIAQWVSRAANRQDWPLAWRLVGEASTAEQRIEALVALGSSATASGATAELQACWRAMSEATAESQSMTRAACLLPLSGQQPPEARTRLLAEARPGPSATPDDMRQWIALVDFMDEPARGPEWRAMVGKAATLPSAIDRVYVLIAIASRVHDEDVTALALEEIAALADPSKRAYALSAFSPHIGQGLQDRALQVAAGIPDEHQRAEALRSLALVLDEPGLRDALSCLDDFVSNWKNYAGCGLAVGLARLGQSDEALACWTESAPTISRGADLGALAAHLPRDLLPRALDLAEELTGYDQDKALLGLLTRVAELGDLPAAFAGAARIDWLESRAQLLAELVPRLQHVEPSVIFDSWAELLAASAARSRTHLLSDLRCTAPLLGSLVSPEDLRRTADAILETGRWFP